MRLESCGYSNLVTAENGREALEKIRSGPVDLVLLDIMMPELDGYGVLARQSERPDPSASLTANMLCGKCRARSNYTLLKASAASEKRHIHRLGPIRVDTGDGGCVSFHISRYVSFSAKERN